MSRHHGGRDWNRDDDRDRSRDRKRERSRERGRRSPTFEPDNADEGREEPVVTGWIPSPGIDYDVISEELSLFLGPSATVKRGKLANVRHPDVTPL